MSVTKEDGTEFEEKRTLEGLSEVIGKHGISGAVGDVDVAAFGVVGDEKITDVNVSGALAGRGTAMAFEFDGAFVVLVENGGINGVALGLHEVFNI